MTRIATRTEDLHKGDTVIHRGYRYSVAAAIREHNGTVTLRLQIPGTPAVTFHNADPGFAFTRIAR